MSYRVLAQDRADRYRVQVEEYAGYQREGFLVVRELVPGAEVDALREHAMDLLHGRVEVPGVSLPPAGATEAELLQRFSRVHQLHRVDPVAERYLLQPRVLDVLEALIGPDVLALQTMLFYNPPGRGGQGWHQDSYYITTYPDTLIGAWIALDAADEENGCLWVAPGSRCEAIYPSPDPEGGFVHSDGAFADLEPVENVSHLDDSINALSPVARRYQWLPVPVAAGDVVFFHGHLLHRSYPNRSADRWRRAFVSHYCNARSWVPWNHGVPYEGESANHCHLLARGATHLPYAGPQFGTPCAALDPPTVVSRQRPARMAAKEGEMVRAWDPEDSAWRSKPKAFTA
jgi:hypothetical protein